MILVFLYATMSWILSKSTATGDLRTVEVSIHILRTDIYSLYWELNSISSVLQTNTFQGIVITNGYQSYTVFTYRCGLMGWAANAVIGFKAANNFYQNHNLSGNSGRLIACQNSAVTSWYNVLYPLRKLCYSAWSPT